MQVELGEIFKVSSGGTPSRKNPEYFKDGNIAWIKTGDLKEKHISTPSEFITQLGLDNSSAKLFPPKTVLLAMYGATIGECSILSFEAATNQACAAILPSVKCNESYLYYYLTSIKALLIVKGVGGAQPNISAGLVKKLKIPLPPLAEQQKIAAILDAADSLRQKDQQLIEHYTSLSQSLFLEMFGDPVSNPMGWDIKPFDFFARIDTQMTTDFIKYADVPHIGIANIEKETGKLDNYNLVRDENLTSGKYVFTSEHIIYSKIRPNLNKVALPTFNGLSSADSYPILVNADNTNRLFFAYILRSPCFVDFILKHSSRTNIPKANKAQMRLFKGVAPPITLQNQFAETIQAIEAQKQQAQASLEKSEALFNSLLQRAFKGELTA